MEIDAGSFVIRDWKESDAVLLQKNADDRGIWLNLRDTFPHPYTLNDAQNWINFANRSPVTHFAIIVDGGAAGAIGFRLQEGNHSKSAEIGYWLGRAHWGKGIATRALCAITEYAFGNFDLCRLFALVHDWNPTSMRVLEKAGYEYEGRLRKSLFKDGQILDEVVYSKLHLPVGTVASPSL